MHFGIVPSSGMGDALIFSIAAHHLKSKGHQVTFFHHLFPQFGSWLEPGDYHSLASIEELRSFDAILLQHDNTERASRIAALRNVDAKIYIFYPNYRFSKHGALLHEFDVAFDEERNMVENLLIGMAKLFKEPSLTQNSLHPKQGLIHQKYRNRVAIHPTSGAEWRNWPQKKFLKLANLLKQIGLQPYFLMSPQERSGWPEEVTPHLPTLEDLASFLYESGLFIGNNSGLGHLASYLHIPHVILGHQERHMRQWRPGWLPGICLYPPRWVPNWKGVRMRERQWHRFISTRKVLKALNRIHNLI